MSLHSRISAFAGSFSFVGLVLAGLFFAVSITPSLLPRIYLVQGVLSGFAIAVGYGIGVGLFGLYRWLEFSDPPPWMQRGVKWPAAFGLAVLLVVFLYQLTFWQNSVRELMDMPPLETGYPFRVSAVALVTSLVLVLSGRLISAAVSVLARRLDRWVPKRVAMICSISAITLLLVFIGNGVVARGLLSLADDIFLQLDELVDDGIAAPSGSLASGGPGSLIEWEGIGRQGKHFVLHGPGEEKLSEFLGREAKTPIRVYVGKRSRDTSEERAHLAVEELKRVGGFERAVLIIATPTGTGWLDPGGVDTIEYLYGGDSAIVATQYSYLPSWMTIVVDPKRSIESARDLFRAVYGHWTTLPPQQRPRLFLHGLSLGALGSEVSSNLVTIFEDPVQGGVWAGPPFPSRLWTSITASRNPGSPQWLPRFKDGRMVRFINQFETVDPEKPWGPMRFVYVQYASDPMSFFSPDIAFRRPDWLSEPRGPDVSPHLRWFPVVTFLQLGFDLPMATAIPSGYGHNIDPSDYINAWVAVTDPPGWEGGAIARLQQYFRERGDTSPKLSP